MSEFSEDSRVKFPALIHLVGMGFEYISSNNSAKPQEQQEPYDPLTNILTKKFKDAFLALNPELTEEDAEKKLADIQTSVGYNDLGRRLAGLSQGQGCLPCETASTGDVAGTGRFASCHRERAS